MNSASNFYKKLKKTLNEIGEKTNNKKATFKAYIENASQSAHARIDRVAKSGNAHYEEEVVTHGALESYDRDEKLFDQVVEVDEGIVNTPVSEVVQVKASNLKPDDASWDEEIPSHIKTREAILQQKQLEEREKAEKKAAVKIGRFGSKVDEESDEAPIKIAKTVAGASRKIYADYASLTPIDPRVKKVMIDAMDEYTANPSSIYAEGVKSKQALERARTSVGTFFGVQPSEIIFTSGGTESNNLAFKGVIEACEKEIREVGGDSSAKPHIVISTLEHPSIIEIALDLIQKGYDVSFVPVNEDGIVDPKDIRKALTPETILVSVMYANNEIGTIQPIKEITREVRHYKKSLNRSNGDYPYVHTDACQAVLYEDMRIPGLNIDLLTIDGGKVYGPRSTGVLVKRNYVKMNPILNGGSQEHGLRAGTENVSAILGLTHALDIAHNEKEDEVTRLKNLTESLRGTILGRLSGKLPGISINGDLDNRLSNNLNICFPGLDAEFMVIRLDVLGVMLSSVTSCRASNEDSSSYVIEALGKSDCSSSSLRITLGRNTTTLDVAHIGERIIQVVEEQLVK